MPRSYCVENCSNNAKSQLNLNFILFNLVSNDVSVDCKQLVRFNSVLSFCTPSCSTAVCKGSVFLQFCNKIQSRMHQIFTQMYLTVSIGQSHMERPKESFIKTFFFRGDSHPIFPYLNLPPNENPPKQVHVILPSSPYPPKQVQKTHEASR